jgi:hypothetical protein
MSEAKIYTAREFTILVEQAVAEERERYETLRWLVAGGVDLFKGAPGGGEMTQAEAEKWVDEQVDKISASMKSVKAGGANVLGAG